jgi:superfamily II DNA helicase RecQ
MQAAIVFCNHRDAAERMGKRHLKLEKKEYTNVYHGGMSVNAH